MGNISVGGAGIGTLGGSGLTGQITGNIDTGASTMVDFALRRAENTTATLGSQVYFGRQRGTLGTAGTVVTGDNLLTLNAYGHDGTDYVISSQILADVEGTVAANQLPGRLIFKTANSTGTLTEALRIDSNQNITQSNGLFFPIQRTTANAPAYVKGGMYFDTTLNKLMIGGATAWEAVTSI